MRPGEIVGVAGVSGNGQRELSDVVLGVRAPHRGTKLLWSEDASRWSIATVRAKGVASIPDDPLALACVASPLPALAATCGFWFGALGLGSRVDLWR